MSVCADIFCVCVCVCLCFLIHTSQQSNGSGRVRATFFLIRSGMSPSGGKGTDVEHVEEIRHRVSDRNLGMLSRDRMNRVLWLLRFQDMLVTPQDVLGPVEGAGVEAKRGTLEDRVFLEELDARTLSQAVHSESCQPQRKVSTFLDALNDVVLVACHTNAPSRCWAENWDKEVCVCVCPPGGSLG